MHMVFETCLPVVVTPHLPGWKMRILSETRLGFVPASCVSRYTLDAGGETRTKTRRSGQKMTERCFEGPAVKILSCIDSFLFTLSFCYYSVSTHFAVIFQSRSSRSNG
jgi:hypothetical protein